MTASAHTCNCKASRFTARLLRYHVIIVAIQFGAEELRLATATGNWEVGGIQSGSLGACVCR